MLHGTPLVRKSSAYEVSQSTVLRQKANEILRKASAYFALAELDRPFRR